MKVSTTTIPGVLTIEPEVFNDTRGFFMETYHRLKFHSAGINAEFVQDNHSSSIRGTLRGLHYQVLEPQGKLCRVVFGEVFDVCVDLRKNSPTFGNWFRVYLSHLNRRQIYIPPGLAHGFCVVSDEAEFLYKCTDFYRPGDQHTLLWNDASLGIEWPIRNPILSQQDAQGLLFSDAPYFESNLD